MSPLSFILTIILWQSLFEYFPEIVLQKLLRTALDILFESFQHFWQLSLTQELLYLSYWWLRDEIVDKTTFFGFQWRWFDWIWNFLFHLWPFQEVVVFIFSWLIYNGFFNCELSYILLLTLKNPLSFRRGEKVNLISKSYFARLEISWQYFSLKFKIMFIFGIIKQIFPLIFVLPTHINTIAFIESSHHSCINSSCKSLDNYIWILLDLRSLGLWKIFSFHLLKLLEGKTKVFEQFLFTLEAISVHFCVVDWWAEHCAVSFADWFSSFVQPGKFLVERLL